MIAEVALLALSLGLASIFVVNLGFSSEGRPPAFRRPSYLTLRAARTESPPSIDGRAEALWRRAAPLRVKTFAIKKFGNRRIMEVELRALYTQEEIFFLARWKDDTQSLHYKPWVFDGKKWHEERDLADDAFAFNWNISSRLFPLIGCRAACHLSSYPDHQGLTPHDMWTAKPGELLDQWEWRATETAPLGWMKDAVVAHLDFAAFVQKNPGAKPRGRLLDKVRASPDLFKFNADFYTDDRPMYVPNPKKGGDIHAPYLHVTGPDSLVPIKGITFKKGDRVGGIVLPPEVPPPVRGDLVVKGRYAEGGWTLEIKRKLRTNDSDDVQFDPAKREGYYFGVAVFDHSVYHNFSDVLRLVFE
ncbi:MAG: ethylbenzene dehydrogenase-related protein [Nitrospinota bacterium]